MDAREEIEALIARCALGDRAAFGTLYDRTSAKLFGVALRVLGTRAEAEDALQDIFVKIWGNAGRYRANGLSPMTWLITIARNHAVDLRRRRAGTERHAGGDSPQAVAEVPDSAPGPEAQAVAADERGRLVACLAELDSRRADAVRRAYLLGETYAELAERFSVPLNTMRTLLRRSLLKLRECMTR